MPFLSKAERLSVIIFLLIGLSFTGFSYSKKVLSYAPLEEFSITEPHLLININKASFEELQRLPGIGPFLADEIISYRQRTGNFKSIYELRNVKGIGAKKFEKIKDFISVSDWNG